MSDQIHLPAVIDLEAYRGDSWAQPFRFRNGDNPEDLSGATVTSQARGPTGAATPMTVVVTDGVAGEFALYQPLDGLPPDRYDYDIQVNKSGVIVTWVHGWLTVTKDVTR